MSFLPAKTSNQLAAISAKYLPDGKAWVNKFVETSNLFKLLKGTSIEFGRLEQLLDTYINSFDIRNSTELLEQWEGALGLPNDWLPLSNSIEDRQRAVIAMLAADGTQTAQDIVDVIAILGFDVTITTGYAASVFPVDFPWVFAGDETDAKFTIVVNFEPGITDSNPFPIPFPYPFGGSKVNKMRSFIEYLAPANVQVIFAFTE